MKKITETKKMTDKSAKSQGPSQKGLAKILLADDSPNIHKAVAVGLRKEPYELIYCDNGQDALRLVKEQKPQVLLADLDMPGPNGAELCGLLRKDPHFKDLKIILLCGSFDQVDDKHLESVPADARLWKPFESHVLISVLNTVLKSPPLREQPSPTSLSHPGQSLPRERTDITTEMTRETFQKAAQPASTPPTRPPLPKASRIEVKESEDSTRPLLAQPRTKGSDDELWSMQYEAPSTKSFVVNPDELPPSRSAPNPQGTFTHFREQELPEVEDPFVHNAPLSNDSVPYWSDETSAELPAIQSPPDLDATAALPEAVENPIYAPLEDRFIEATLNRAAEYNAAPTVERGASLDEAQIREIVRSELNQFLKDWMQQHLQKELDQILAQIDKT